MQKPSFSAIRSTSIPQTIRVNPIRGSSIVTLLRFQPPWLPRTPLPAGCPGPGTPHACRAGAFSVPSQQHQLPGEWGEGRPLDLPAGHLEEFIPAHGRNPATDDNRDPVAPGTGCHPGLGVDDPAGQHQGGLSPVPDEAGDVPRLIRNRSPAETTAISPPFVVVINP